MNKYRFAKQVAASAGFFFLCTATWLAAGQSMPSSQARPPQTASPAAPTNKDAGQDPYAGIEFSPEQRAKIAQVHREFKVKRDAVIKDDKLDEDKKGAFITGLKRLENQEVMKVLTPEQQKVAKARELAKRQAQKSAERGQAPPTQ